MLEKIACRGKEDIAAMVIELDHIFGEFEDLECPYPDELKKVTLLTKLQLLRCTLYQAYLCVVAMPIKVYACHVRVTHYESISVASYKYLYSILS